MGKDLERSGVSEDNILALGATNEDSLGKFQ
jgi:hypothetical protein